MRVANRRNSLVGHLIDTFSVLTLISLVMAAYLAGVPWLIPILLVLSFYIRFQFLLNEFSFLSPSETQKENIKTEDAMMKNLIKYALLFVIAPAFFPLVIFSYDWSDRIDFFDAAAQRIAILYAGIYDDTNGVNYIPTSLGILRIPSMYFGLRHLGNPPSDWFKIDMFIIYSVNIAVAYVSLIGAAIFGLWNIHQNNYIFFSLNFKNRKIQFSVLTLVIVIFGFMTWHVLCDRTYHIISNAFGLALLNMMPFLVYILLSCKVSKLE